MNGRSRMLALMLVLAAISAMLLISAHPALTECEGPGKARWSNKTNVPGGTDLKHPKPIPLTDLLTLASASGVTQRDALHMSE